MKLLNKIKRFKLVVFFFRISNLGYGRCTKCGLPWNCCKEKTVYYKPYQGTFATCQYCWDNSSLDVLKRCYSETYSDQLRGILMMNNRMGASEKMGHSRQDLLNAVEREFNKENIKRRKQKINSLKKRTKKNRTKYVSLHQED